MYKISKDGSVYDKGGASVPLDDREPSYQAYAAWLARGGEPDPVDIDAPPAPDTELDSAQEWGARLVRDFEAQALKGGVNDDPDAALALDRYLREVSGAVAAGRLHVAYAALGELLTTPERERPAPPFTDDAALVPVFNALATRIKRDPWSKR